MIHSSKGFTLIELLIVIVIIGILAVALIPRLTGMQVKARDTRRIADLRQMQNALELYASDNNGSYPTTSGTYRSSCSNHGSHPLYGATGYVPYLAPDYISVLPSDPKTKEPNECYLYRSNGIDYIVMAHLTVEGIIPEEFKRPLQPYKTMAVYSAGAKMW